MVALSRGVWRWLIVLLLFMPMLLWAGWSACETPVWWAAASRCSGEAGKERAQVVESAFVAALHKVRKDGERWAVSILQDDLNAWLSCRAPEWIAFDDSIAELARIADHRVRFHEEAMTVARSDSGFIGSVVVCPRVIAGKISIQLLKASLGTMPVPAAFLGLDLTELQAGVEVALLAPLADGRRVELLDLEVGEGTLALAFRTHDPRR
ncbi:MAG: hypothetical protein EXS00_00705 [Phycisphaerales bacterium]|nr:hypothetical protein [Phycisphaerales bacterium]